MPALTDLVTRGSYSFDEITGPVFRPRDFPEARNCVSIEPPPLSQLAGNRLTLDAAHRVLCTRPKPRFSFRLDSSHFSQGLLRLDQILKRMPVTVALTTPFVGENFRKMHHPAGRCSDANGNFDYIFPDYKIDPSWPTPSRRTAHIGLRFANFRRRCYERAMLRDW